MRVMFAGTPATAVPSLAALIASDHEVVAVLTRPDAPVGRRRALTPSPVAAAAREAGVPVLKRKSVRGDEFAAEFRALGVDAVAVVAYGALIPEALLDAAPHGWINLHFSLLPAWRGASPVQAAIRAGDEITGASAFLIEKELDTGPVLGTVTEEIGPHDTAGDLLARLADSGSALLVATLDGLEAGLLHARPQPTDGVSYAGKIVPADARIDFTAPALAVDRHIRSVTPAPGAWVDSRGGRLHLGPVTIVGEADAAGMMGRAGMTSFPGELAVGKRDVLVRTGSGVVRLGTVRPPGKKDIPAADWARGARVQSGDRLDDAVSTGDTAVRSEGTTS